MDTKNYLRENLDTNRFIITIEYAVPLKTKPLDEAIALATWAAKDPRVSALGVSDRVIGPDCHSPVDVGIEVFRRTGKMPLVHIAGKDHPKHQDWRCNPGFPEDDRFINRGYPQIIHPAAGELL